MIDTKRKLLINENGEIQNWYTVGINSVIPGNALDIEESAYKIACDISATHYINGAFTRSIPEPTEEELYQKFKDDRAQAVAAITVEVDNMTFDGDETSQDRMSRAIVSLEPQQTITWVLTNNIPTTVTREQLQTALKLSGLAQTALWVQP